MVERLRIYQYLKKVASIKDGVLFRVVFGQEIIKETIIDLNTVDQLYEKGIGSDGIRLDEKRGAGYSQLTIYLKNRKGQPTDRITLKDTGDFYRSFRVIVSEGLIEIRAKEPEGGMKLTEEFGAEIYGLTSESIEKLKPLIIEKYKEYIYGLL